MTSDENPLRRLPSVDQVARVVEEGFALKARMAPGAPSRPEVVRAAREALDLLRAGLSGGAPGPGGPAAPPGRSSSDLPSGDPPLGAPISRDHLLALAISTARRILDVSARPSLGPVINATGVVLHTNLGRARLAPEAAQAVALAAGHVNLELDLSDGHRRSRQDHVRGLLRDLTGAEDALVVNNNAAAVWLVLRTLARGGDVVISRGELVEIGESFRLPEIMAEAGVTLVEVGTTNRTTAGDYARALGVPPAPGGRPPADAVGPAASGEDGDRPAGHSFSRPVAVVLVHPSNYRVVGFTGRPSRREVTALAREAGVPVFEDLGSGVLHDLSPWGLEGEPVAGRALAEGVDLITFSGDKLLGGPQCGVIAGRGDLVARLRSAPVLRCLRPDKLTLAALEATLRLHRNPETALGRIPALRALTEPPEAVRRRATRALGLIRRRLSGPAAGTTAGPAPGTAAGPAADPARAGLALTLVQDKTEAGGGSLPGVYLPTWAVGLSHASFSPDRLWRLLASATPPVIGRRSRNAFLLDFRSVADDEVPALATAVAGALLAAAKDTARGGEPA